MSCTTTTQAPTVVVIGPPRSGKSTLARFMADESREHRRQSDGRVMDPATALAQAEVDIVEGRYRDGLLEDLQDVLQRRERPAVVVWVARGLDLGAEPDTPNEAQLLDETVVECVIRNNGPLSLLRLAAADLLEACIFPADLCGGVRSQLYQKVDDARSGAASAADDMLRVLAVLPDAVFTLVAPRVYKMRGGVTVALPGRQADLQLQCRGRGSVLCGYSTAYRTDVTFRFPVRQPNRWLQVVDAWVRREQGVGPL